MTMKKHSKLLNYILSNTERRKYLCTKIYLKMEVQVILELICYEEFKKTSFHLIIFFLFKKETKIPNSILAGKLINMNIYFF